MVAILPSEVAVLYMVVVSRKLEDFWYWTVWFALIRSLERRLGDVCRYVAIEVVENKKDGPSPFTVRSLMMMMRLRTTCLFLRVEHYSNSRSNLSITDKSTFLRI